MEMTDPNDITTLPEFFRRVQSLKGLSLDVLARAAGINAANASRLSRSTLRPSPQTLDAMAVREAWGCPWWSAQENREFLRRLAVELTGSTNYGEIGLYFVRPLVALVRSQWFVPSSSREIVQLWPALGLPGWHPAPAKPADPIADPIWWWAADETYRLDDSDSNPSWSARWTTAAAEPGALRDHIIALAISHVAAGASRLSTGQIPADEPPAADSADTDWWQRYHDRVLSLPPSDQFLIKSLIDRLSNYY